MGLQAKRESVRHCDACALSLTVEACRSFRRILVGLRFSADALFQPAKAAAFVPMRKHRNAAPDSATGNSQAQSPSTDTA